MSSSEGTTGGGYNFEYPEVNYSIVKTYSDGDQAEIHEEVTSQMEEAQAEMITAQTHIGIANDSMASVKDAGTSFAGEVETLVKKVLIYAPVENIGVNQWFSNLRKIGSESDAALKQIQIDTAELASLSLSYGAVSETIGTLLRAVNHFLESGDITIDSTKTASELLDEFLTGKGNESKFLSFLHGAGVEVGSVVAGSSAATIFAGLLGEDAKDLAKDLAEGYVKDGVVDLSSYGSDKLKDAFKSLVGQQFKNMSEALGSGNGFLAKMSGVISRNEKTCELVGGFVAATISNLVINFVKDGNLTLEEAADSVVKGGISTVSKVAATAICTDIATILGLSTAGGPFTFAVAAVSAAIAYGSTKAYSAIKDAIKHNIEYNMDGVPKKYKHQELDDIIDLMKDNGVCFGVPKLSDEITTKDWDGNTVTMSAFDVTKNLALSGASEEMLVIVEMAAGINVDTSILYDEHGNMTQKTIECLKALGSPGTAPDDGWGNDMDALKNEDSGFTQEKFDEAHPDGYGETTAAANDMFRQMFSSDNPDMVSIANGLNGVFYENGSVGWNAVIKDASAHSSYTVSGTTHNNGSYRESTHTVHSANSHVDGYHYVIDERTGTTTYYDNQNNNIGKEAYDAALDGMKASI